jgi:hypothetical protein
MVTFFCDWMGEIKIALMVKGFNSISYAVSPSANPFIRLFLFNGLKQETLLCPDTKELMWRIWPSPNNWPSPRRVKPGRDAGREMKLWQKSCSLENVLQEYRETSMKSFPNYGKYQIKSCSHAWQWVGVMSFRFWRNQSRRKSKSHSHLLPLAPYNISSKFDLSNIDMKKYVNTIGI